MAKKMDKFRFFLRKFEIKRKARRDRFWTMIDKFDELFRISLPHKEADKSSTHDIVDSAGKGIGPLLDDKIR
jgi:hypothetical protein